MLMRTPQSKWTKKRGAGQNYFQGVFSDELDVACAAWDGNTKTPFGLPECVPASTAKADEFTAKADASYQCGLDYDQRGDDYSFLTAMSQRRGPEWAQRSLLWVALGVAVAGVTVLANFPIEW
jgi:hypothetical protein